jgi:nucleotide-binding universal stress UspA family protein
MRIVVGVDGSAGARRALEWSIAEARARSAGLTALLAYGYYGRPLDVQASITGFDPAQLDEAALMVLRQAVADVAPGPTCGEIEERVSDSEPVDALLDEVRSDDLLVVGARGLGPVRRLLLGSVSLQCTRHASCPTVIVREPREPREPRGAADVAIAARPVVVGVDGSPESQTALHWAAEHARCHAVPLEVVHAWPVAETQPAEVDELFRVTAQRDQHRRDIEGLVDSAVDPLQRADVTVRFFDGNAVAVLLEAAEAASLLVVGSRGQGGIARLLLGSTSAACLLHAACNVAVVPQPNGSS